MNGREFNTAKALYGALCAAKLRVIPEPRVRRAADGPILPFESLAPELQRQLLTIANAAINEVRKKSPYGEGW